MIREISYTFSVQPKAEAFITRDRNRLKQIEQSVYLNDRDSFEIELFNPKTISVLAKIKINGDYISERGIVVKPGQRVYLDRHIDEAKKFLFSTYEVDATNQSVKDAIQYNGLVEIEFYNEEEVKHSYSYSHIDYFPNTFYNNTLYNTTFPPSQFTTKLCLNSDLPINQTSVKSGSLTGSLTETGRVERGGDSNTKLINFSAHFESYISSVSVWRILPNSQKPVEVSELKSYCQDCGARIKKVSSAKYCSNCGNKL